MQNSREGIAAGGHGGAAPPAFGGNLFALIEARVRPQDPFVETEEGRLYLYRDMLSLTARYAHALAACGVGPGDRVAAQVEKSPEAYCLYLAVLRMGAIYVPLNTAYTTAELEYFLSDASPAVLVCDPDLFEVKLRVASACGVGSVLTLDAAGRGRLDELASTQPETFATVRRGAGDIAAILYTSGTTGRQKGAMLTHGNLVSNAEALARGWGFTRRDVLLHALPIFHAHGLFISAHCALLSGSSMLFMRKFAAERVVELLPRASVMMGVPTYYTRLLDTPGFGPDRCHGIRLFVSGSAPLLAETSRELTARTGHVPLERYGMTEAIVITSNPLEGERQPGSVGFPVDGVELRIAGTDDAPLPPGSVGGVQIRGSSVMLGYWNMPEKTAEEYTADGWFRTGDLGKIEENGHVTLVGRAKDLVISGGFNVYPKEIELAIDAIPGVAESAVIGVPHRDFGEAVTAVVVRRDPALGAAEIIERLRTRLAAYKVPKQVQFVEELPRNAMGKVLKTALRATLSAAAPGSTVSTTTDHIKR